MKKYLVKIDLNSIKKNENAGRTQTRMYAGRTIKFKAHKLPDSFKNGQNCIIQQYKITEGNCCDYEGLIIDDELVNEVFNKSPEGAEVEIEKHYDTIQHMPIPEYSYNYENKKVKCSNCGAEIMTEELELEYDEIDIDSYSYTVCPKCKEWDCVELKYENINDALKRIWQS